jgi:hypothetical protein
LQIALERLSVVEKQRQSAVEELQATQAAPHMRQHNTGSGSAQAPTGWHEAAEHARADADAALVRASEAEARLDALQTKLQSAQAHLVAHLSHNVIVKLHHCGGRTIELIV